MKCQELYDNTQSAMNNLGIEEELVKFSRWDVSQDDSQELTAEKKHLKVEAYIEVIEGPDKGKKCRLKKGHSVLGRGKVDIALRDTDISRTHAEIEIFGGSQMFIRDLASTNGTYVNNKKVSYSRLQDGDVIQTGATVMKFIVPE